MQFKNGDEAIFKQLFDTYFKELVIYVKKYTNDIDVAQDIVQEVFVKLFEKRETLDIHTSLKSFLYVSARNRALDYIRTRKRRQSHHEELSKTSDLHTTMADEEIQEETALQAKIYEVISELPKKNQEIFRLSRLEGKTNEEIAIFLGISKRTVETHISNALKKLRQRLSSFVKIMLWCLLNYFF